MVFNFLTISDGGGVFFPLLFLMLYDRGGALVFNFLTLADGSVSKYINLYTNIVHATHIFSTKLIQSWT